jgi:hypothetical protein
VAVLYAKAAAAVFLPVSLPPDMVFFCPITGSIAVTVDGGFVVNDVHHGWTYHIGGNAIVFHGDAVPMVGQAVEIAYNYLS